MTLTKEGIVYGMSDDEYHSMSDRLSSTGAKKILDSPARFEYWRTHSEAPKAAYDLGHAVHAKVLGTGSEVVVFEYPDWRTNAARSDAADARLEGKVPMLAKDYAPVEAMAESVLAHPTARQLLTAPGNAEVSVFADDPDTGIPLRARFDYLPDDYLPVAVDLKTTQDASVDGFTRSVAKFGYDIQRSHYLHTYEIANVAPATDMFFVAVETHAPYLVAVHALPAVWAFIGDEKAKRARELYAQCTASGEWPGYGDEVHYLDPPAWVIYEHQDHLLLESDEA